MEEEKEKKELEILWTVPNVAKYLGLNPVTVYRWGDEQEVIRLVCDVDTKEGLREKFFDNGTQRWSQELTDKGIQIGSGFSITRTGL